MRWRCVPEKLMFESTAEIEPASEVLGQATARDALAFGLQSLARGQNVFVRGTLGTGRSKMVNDLLAHLQPVTDDLKDFCYVHNFSRPDHPRLIVLPAGQATQFRESMQQLAEYLRSELPKELDAEPHRSSRQSIQQRFREDLQQLSQPLEAELEALQMAMVPVSQGATNRMLIVPVVEGKPIPLDEFRDLVQHGKLPQSRLADFERDFPDLQKRLVEMSELISERMGQVAVEVRKMLTDLIHELFAKASLTIRSQFPDQKVDLLLKEISDYAADVFLRNHAEEESSEAADFDTACGVNIVLHHQDSRRRPIVEEMSPTIINLLGTVEPTWNSKGGAQSDYRGIRAGAILNANQGYLILDAKDVLAEPGAWRSLIRTLRTERLEIVPPELGWMRQQLIIFPEPIDVKLRVILIGDVRTWHMLDQLDPDFSELFKVLADIDEEIPRDDAGIDLYCHVLASLCRSEGLPPFNRYAVAAIIEHGARIAARANKLTARFGRIGDIAIEAAFLSNGELVNQDNVWQAIERTKTRASLPSRRFWEMVQNRSLNIQTSGDVAGQINGLAVMRYGPLTYGFPARITASIGPGTAGVINVEGSSQLSGAIHTKGFHILGGLLRKLLSTQHPLAFSASLAFEQSYGGIDGDSASTAEIICLLSALTDIPIKQNLAITGAIDQLGNIQAIGGATEKIEGFFDVCKCFGLTGDQGVIIPKSNINDLMLRTDVLHACREGKFFVYAVDNIFDALEIMTGVSAGRMEQSQPYPTGSLLAIAQARAEIYWRMSLANPHAPYLLQSPFSSDQPGN